MLKIKVIDKYKNPMKGVKVQVKFTGFGRELSYPDKTDENGLADFSGCSEGCGYVLVNGKEVTDEIWIGNGLEVKI